MEGYPGKVGLGLESVIRHIRIIQELLERYQLEKEAMWDLLRMDGRSPEELEKLLNIAREDPALKAQVAQKYTALRDSIEKTLNDALVEAIAGEQARALTTGGYRNLD